MKPRAIEQKGFVPAGKVRYTANVPKLQPFDYFSAVLGLFGTVLISGVFGEVANPVIVFSGILSTMLCLYSMGPLGMNLIFQYLHPIEQRLYAFHALLNLPPTIYFLAHLTETPWEKFVF